MSNVRGRILNPPRAVESDPSHAVQLSPARRPGRSFKPDIMIEPGTLLQNRYRVTRQIGRGGMGAVYVATDERFNSTVAIKQTFFFDDPALRKAFEREAILLNHLRHAALPKVSDHFVEDEGQFLVMEYVEGSDLGELLKARRGAFPVADVMRWADELLDALEYLHTQEPPVVHRDIKPQNIKRTARGQLFLLDFGLAKGDPSRASASVTASVVGYSPQYAPLEQVHGTGTDPRSDLYSLGATLYHLLTGAPPVDALTRAGALVNNEADPLRPAHVVRPEVPVAVSRCIRRAMSQKAALRPKSAAEMRELLRQALGAAAPTSPAAFARAQTPNGDATVVESQTAVAGSWAVRSFGETTVDAKRLGAHYSVPTHVSPHFDTTPEPKTFSSTAKLLVVAAVVVVCAVVSFPLLRRTGAPSVPAAPASNVTTPAGESPAGGQTDATGAQPSGAAGTSLNNSDAAGRTQTSVPTTSTNAPSSDAQTATGSGGADANGGGSSAGATNAPAPAATPTENRAPIVIVVNPTPTPGASAPSESAENARRAEDARRAEEMRREEDMRRAEDERRRQQGPPPGGGPPPYGGPFPPPRGGPPPPPRRPPF
jgi:serine/threonine protein kinase